MHIGKCVFAQIVSFLPQRQFGRIVLKYPDKTWKWCWKVEIFFKWIKQHLRVKRFRGESENAARILGSSLLVKDNLRELFEHRQEEKAGDGHLELDFLN